MHLFCKNETLHDITTVNMVDEAELQVFLDDVRVHLEIAETSPSEKSIAEMNKSFQRIHSRLQWEGAYVHQLKILQEYSVRRAAATEKWEKHQRQLYRQELEDGYV